LKAGEQDGVGEANRREPLLQGMRNPAGRNGRPVVPAVCDLNFDIPGLIKVLSHVRVSPGGNAGPHAGDDRKGRL